MTQAINLNGMGIQELAAAINKQQATVKQVFDIVDARIAKRIAEKRPLLKPVVDYRNSLAEILQQTGISVTQVAAPTYHAKANTALPSDPEQLADVVFATVGAANIGAVIQRLTARVVGV